MDKLNITKGEWQVCHSTHTFIEAMDEGLMVCELDYEGNDPEECEANAKAIVTAVNSTYKQGIDPEAVPDMLEALKGMCREYKKALRNNFAAIDDLDNEYLKSIESLKKAEL